MNDELEKLIQGELTLFHDPAGYETRADLRMSFWSTLIAYYKVGLPIENHHIAELLRRREPIPAVAQAFLAEAYFDPPAKRGRGAPAKPALLRERHQREAAEAFVEGIDTHRNRAMDLKKALAAYSRAHRSGAGLDSLERKYTRSRGLLRNYWISVKADIETAIRVGFEMSPVTADLRLMLEKANTKIAEYFARRRKNNS